MVGSLSNADARNPGTSINQTSFKPSFSIGLEEFRRLLQEPVSAEEIRATLLPPLHFAQASFANYKPQPNYPSQAEAREAAARFVKSSPVANPSWFSSLRDRIFLTNRSHEKGLYLDGGFGVGKTHLLAAAYHAFDGKKAYLSFQELMFLVGLERLDQTMIAFSSYDLLAIDEFELDDPANTRIASTLITGLLQKGVKILSTSNTPPGAVGEGKFSTQDFQRELGALAQQFQDLRIEGEDYRISHDRNQGLTSRWLRVEDLGALVAVPEISSAPNGMLRLSWQELLMLLSSAHPIRVRRAIQSFDSLILTEVKPFEHPHDALRFVYLIDKAYDANLTLFVSSHFQIGDLFPRSIYIGGDTKKYLRTMSRLREMTQSKL